MEQSRTVDTNIIGGQKKQELGTVRARNQNYELAKLGTGKTRNWQNQELEKLGNS